MKWQENRFPQNMLTPGAAASATSREYDLTDWERKTLWVVPVGAPAVDDCVVTIEQKLKGSAAFYPMKSYKSGIAAVNEVFGLTLDGDVVDKIRIRVTAGATPPTYVEIHVYGGRYGA